MIQANELRIGNWIADHEAGGCFKIESIYKNMKGVYWVSYRNESITCSIDELEPIPLTEEWLVKFGYTKSKCDTYWWNDNNITLYYNVFDKLSNYYGYELKYVHQLQNHYFALTGEELTLR